VQKNDQHLFIRLLPIWSREFRANGGRLDRLCLARISGEGGRDASGPVAGNPVAAIWWLVSATTIP
jgi:hypothetical protein